jgi:hypothetical protein
MDLLHAWLVIKGFSVFFYVIWSRLSWRWRLYAGLGAVVWDCCHYSGWTNSGVPVSESSHVAHILITAKKLFRSSLGLFEICLGVLGCFGYLKIF